MNTKIIAVRHGETHWNLLKKLQGHSDSNLTDTGINQSKLLAQRLKKYKIDRFYSSDLGRAVQTAKIISSTIKKNFIVTDQLRERDLGVLQGLTKHEYTQLYPEVAHLFHKRDSDYSIPRGESINECFNRCISYVESLNDQYKGESILIVTHGGILMYFMYRVLRLPLHHVRTFSVFNASINIFIIDENKEWYLNTWGNIDHLLDADMSCLDDVEWIRPG